MCDCDFSSPSFPQRTHGGLVGERARRHTGSVQLLNVLCTCERVPTRAAHLAQACCELVNALDTCPLKILKHQNMFQALRAVEEDLAALDSVNDPLSTRFINCMCKPMYTSSVHVHVQNQCPCPGVDPVFMSMCKPSVHVHVHAFEL